jgi:hypothetical protein
MFTSIPAAVPTDSDAIEPIGPQAESTQRFILLQTTIVLVEVRGCWIAESLPSGAIVALLAPPIPDSEYVELLWDGRSVRMFSIDLQQRGLPCWQCSIPDDMGNEEAAADLRHGLTAELNPP